MTSAPQCQPLTDPEHIDAAAALSLRSHAGLRHALPFLPSRSVDDLAGRLQWMREKGELVGLFDGTELVAFLGAFPVDNFRNAGRGAFGPDWCSGFAPDADPARALPLLYRDLAPRLVARDCRIHAFALYASERVALQALHLAGFGRIVMDAARPTAEMLGDLEDAGPGSPSGIDVTPAQPADADELARLEADLAAHIAAPPVLMPNTVGRPAAMWARWLAGADHVALLARHDGAAVGYIKAQEPQDDVTHAVHGPSVLAINGMYVEPGMRRAGVGRGLLAALARRARRDGAAMMSVDCETTNPEAYAFWSRWFSPVAWGLERRV